MKYLHKQVKAGRNCIVAVNFDQPSKVLLLKDSEYNKYKKGKTYSYRGGFSENSPVKFILPESATWHIIVEKGSYFRPKNITASVQVLPPAASSENTSSNGIIEKLEKILNEEK